MHKVLKTGPRAARVEVSHYGLILSPLLCPQADHHCTLTCPGRGSLVRTQRSTQTKPIRMSFLESRCFVSRASSSWREVRSCLRAYSGYRGCCKVLTSQHLSCKCMPGCMKSGWYVQGWHSQQQDYKVDRRTACLCCSKSSDRYLDYLDGAQLTEESQCSQRSTAGPWSFRKGAASLRCYGRTAAPISP